MGKLFRIGPVVMEIQALKVEKNRDFPEIFPPEGRLLHWILLVFCPDFEKT